MASPVSEFVSGFSLLGRGLGLVLRRPRLALLGALPPLVTSVLFTGALVALVLQLERLVRWLTPFTSGWGSGAATLMRIVVGFSLVAGAALLMVITFSALTLALGSPLYDKISEYVDAELGNAPAPVDEPVTTSVLRALRQSATLIAVSLVVGALLFLAGFVPVLGQVLVPVVSAVFGGWVLCIELVGSAFERRGRLLLGERRAAMRLRRARVLGFAVPTFLLLAIPFAAVLVFPAATAGGTILARDLLGPGARGPERNLPARG